MREQSKRPKLQEIKFERLTKEQILALANRLEPRRPEIERTLEFCCATVRHYLGSDWFERHVLPKIEACVISPLGRECDSRREANNHPEVS